MNQTKLKIVLDPLGVFNITDGPLKKKPHIDDGGHLVAMLKNQFVAKRATLSQDPNGDLNLTLSDEA